MGGGGGSYSELEPSLGFKPPSRTASQVCLPLSGRAEWAGELVKYIICAAAVFLTSYSQQHVVDVLAVASQGTRCSSSVADLFHQNQTH